MADLIDRKSVIDVIHKTIFDFFDIVDDDDESPMTYKDEQLLTLNKAIVTKIKALPSAERHGKWIEENRNPRSWSFYCSVCHQTAYDVQPTRINGWVKRCRYAWCPNCGARMDGEQDG